MSLHALGLVLRWLVGGVAALAPQQFRSSVDLPTAQKRLLENAAPKEADFRELVNAAFQESTNRKLPNSQQNVENPYGPEQTAFRNEVYGPLREKPPFRELLRSLARRPSMGGFDFTGGTAAMVLADAPDEEDLNALLDGYRATPAENRAGSARQLGRAIHALQSHEPKPSLVESALSQLKSDAHAGKAAERGAAIEGLFRAGEVATAVAELRPLLVDGADPAETVTVLQSCARLFKIDDLDPFLKARGLAAARGAIEQHLATKEPATSSPLGSSRGRMLRAAIAFLNDAGSDGEFELLTRCVADERTPRLLGMDGLQTLRFALQSRRAKVDAATGEKLDGHYLRLLTSTGERLFALEEQPMDAAEQRRFLDGRDARYNALSYFCDQFQRTPAVKEQLGKELDLSNYLAAIVRARADATDESSGEPSYKAVAEKVENRVLALELLALIQREWNRDPGGLDLFAEAYVMLCGEVQAPLAPPAAIAAFRAVRAAEPTFEIPSGHRPADPFLQSAAAQTIADLGYVVTPGPPKWVIRVDVEHPWPWWAKSDKDAKRDASTEKKAPAETPKSKDG